ncbi:MAG: FadR family transcriptional regulator [Rhodospirillales bacterium]|jgi:GntR family transcriptional regulator, transcriptional repressor for pyruvate dehydrogenase complex|nr:FadR family transcriptional regulator [Rhodospirillales bacterium]
MVRRETLADQVADHVRELIDAEGLQPGDQIPTENEITEKLGVSRGIVREAFRALSASGLINVSSGRRSTVGQLQSGVLEKFFSHALITSQADIHNMMSLRQAIEFSAVRMAAANRSYAHLDRMKTALDGMAASLDVRPVFVIHDFDFHAVVCEASGNVLFKLLLEGLNESILDTMRAGIQNRLTAEENRTVMMLHEDIFKAIENRDETRAETALRCHFDSAITAILENITTDEDLAKIK